MGKSTRLVADVRTHYDPPDDFFALFLDPTMTYTCAYFAEPNMTLEEAQLANMDLAFGKLELGSGKRLLDIGSGWGSAMLRAIAEYDAHAYGLTHSRNQYEYTRRALRGVPPWRIAEVEFADWDQFGTPVDAVLAIGAIEQIPRERYDDFFVHCFSLLPEGGRMLVQTVIGFDRFALHDRGLPADHEYKLFGEFLQDEVFPGGVVPEAKWVQDSVDAAGFRIEHMQSLRTHFARTLDIWSAALMEHRDEAISITSSDVYQRYLRYLTGCAERFRRGFFDQVQYTLVK
ncbi:class I SAM-dependent methyltransferase [Antrihabitans cavernicola]|uniref:SAM-dependent methyltransferase n=1 Tax=Antrihabitans cavernicola TaxID=2495913 RepID=A0A5A7SFY4_9NOCA|nr:class I SAM-dependent methyltransferase [Spelaeibacter cavernicola]KAA0024484.1 SAM-dependent methyltransferase [Spelaeibacter cavernicola]